MDDYTFLISDIEIEYKKYFDIVVKKKYTQIKQQCDAALQKIDSLKKLIPANNQQQEGNNSLDNFKSELNSSSEILMAPIYSAAESKYNKIYLNALSLLKKIVVYNLIKDTEYIKTINILKDFFNTPNEDIQLKVLEIFQYIISSNLVKLTEENINNIISICKLDNIKGHIKSIEIKSAIKLLNNIFFKKIFDITEDANVIKLLKQLMSKIEGTNQKEWNNMTSQNSVIKSTEIEIICQILETFPNKFKQEGDMLIFIEQDMNVFVRKLLVMNQDQLIGIKICRLCMIMILNINKNYNILEEILKYLNKNNQLKWKKTIALELLSEIFKKPEILYDIYINDINLYQNIFQTFTNTAYNTIISKSQKIKEKKFNTPNNQNSSKSKKDSEHNQINIIPNKKYIISTNNIFIQENHQSIIISQNIDYIFKLLTESYISLKNSYVYLIEKNGININESQQMKKKEINLTETQEKIKQMITSNFTDFKGGLISILLYLNDVSTVQSFLGIFQSFIYIFTSFNLPGPKDELLNDLCNLALPNNLQNILEIKEKNILIIRTLFNLSHCTNLLEKNSWKIFLQIVQNLYFILLKNGYYIYGEKQQFEIEIIMKNIYTNIKKYSLESTIVEVQKVVQEDEVNKNINNIMINNTKTKEKTGKRKSSQLRALTNEERENIDILSNVVNNLYTDSNDYDNETLINVMQALYEDIEKKIKFYNKELKLPNKAEKRKNSEDNIQPVNNLEDNISPNVNNEKNNVGKLTVRNPMSKSVMGTKNQVDIDFKEGKFNINFQNNIVMINLSNINYNLVKILEIAIINIQRINLVWDTILSTVKLFANELRQENNYSETIFKFTIELISCIIVNVLLKFNYQENKRDEKNYENFNEKKIQTYLLTPFINLLEGYYNDFILAPELLINPINFILENCGTKLNIYGWENFLNCFNSILFENDEKKNIEILFKMLEQIFNEYSDTLSILNIEVLLDILKKFSLQLENNNISYSSLSFFWQCADIIEKYQNNKKEIKNLESECLNEKIEKNKKDEFYGNLWKKLFTKLLIINNDKRLDIKKSGINLFSQFFVAKLKTINQIKNLSTDIFNEVFYEIFKNNIQDYISDKSTNNIVDTNKNEINQDKDLDKENNIEKENEKVNNEDSINSNDIIINNKEEIILFSLQNLGKIFKSLIEENKQNKNNNSKIYKDIIKQISKLYQELIDKKNSSEISNNILKNLSEFDSGDKLFFQENREIFWDIIYKSVNYISDKNFLKKYAKSVKGNKAIQAICDTLMTCFYSKEDFEILNKDEKIDNNINSFLDMIPKMMESLKILNQSLINLDNFSLIMLEKYIFNIIDSIGIYCHKFSDVENIINFLLKKINYVKEDKHSIAMSVQSLYSLGNIFMNNKDLMNNIEEEKIKNLIIYCKNQIDEFYSFKNDKNILDELIKHNTKKKDIFIWEKMIISFNDLILKSTINKIKDEKLWEEIIDYNIKLYQDLDKEINTNIISEDNNEKEINNHIIKSNENIQKNIINLIMNILLPNSGNISPNIQQKLLNLFDMEDKGDNKDKKLFSLDNMNTENLFNICNFQGEKELLNMYKDIEEKESINKYIEIKKNISKKFLPILFKNCEKEINNYIEAEKNDSNKDELKEKLIIILEGLKNLDSYCEDLDGINKENEILVNCIKNKKGHLFLLQKYFNKLIFANDENIKKKLFEIYEEISKQYE